jgi:hypothetical protein
MKFAVSVLAALTAFVSMHASAADDFGRTLSLTGLAGNSAYAEFVEGLSGPCKFNLVYLGYVDAPQTKASLAMLVAARSSGGKVAHIGYTINSDGTCWATQLEIGP